MATYLQQYVAWWTVSLLFPKPFTISETDRSPRDIAISFLSIYYNIKSIFLVFPPIEEVAFCFIWQMLSSVSIVRRGFILSMLIWG